MATRSSVLAWKIPGTVEPDGLPSMGSHRVGHDSAVAGSFPDALDKAKLPFCAMPCHPVLLL